MQLDSRSVCRDILAFRDVFADKHTHTHTHTHTQTYAYYNTPLSYQSRVKSFFVKLYS